MDETLANLVRAGTQQPQRVFFGSGFSLPLPSNLIPLAALKALPYSIASWRLRAYIKRMTVLRAFILSLALLAPLAAAAPAFADSPPIYTPLRHDIALKGYDTVSYFSGKPIKGQKRFTSEYKGAEWRFSTQANLDLFQTNPEAFIPQYGGYCAWAVAHGKLAKGSPKHWLVEDGRLYLNFNGRIQKQWLADQEDFTLKADKRWPDILRD